MGNCWCYCVGQARRVVSRIRRGRGSKYFQSSTTGEHCTIEFENLIENEEAGSQQPYPRPISEEEIRHLNEHCYAAISDKQMLIDQRLQLELEAQEEKLKLEEESRNSAQREAARLAREHKKKEQLSAQGKADGSSFDPQQREASDFDDYLQMVKAQSEAFRSNRLPSDNNLVTPNTEYSLDFTTKTHSTNDDGTSLDLEWEDEEGMNHGLSTCERSRTEEDILHAALKPSSKQINSGPTSASEDSNALEWENDFVFTHQEDSTDAEFKDFVNPVNDSKSKDTLDCGLMVYNQGR